jgi:serine/threonine-protein kinase
VPTYFHITPASNAVPLNAERRGKATFTVSNASGGPMLARAQLVATDPNSGAWFELAENPEYDFEADDTTQYTVRIAVPASAPAGRHTFRLDMVGVENPDEEYTEGPPVSVVVPEPAKEKKPFPWWILAVAGGVIALGVVLLLLLRPRTFELPPLPSGVTASEAAEFVEFYELKVGRVDEPSAEVPAGHVISASWGRGDRFKPGDVVTLTVSSGPPQVTVPTLRGQPLAEARAALTAVDLVAADEAPRQADDNVPDGSVLRSFPPAGQVVDQGSEVSLIVSSGPSCPGTVPDVTNLPPARASEVLVGACYQVNPTQQEQEHPTVSEGLVIETDPAADQAAPRDTQVTLIVSTGDGLIPVPPVRNTTLAEATDILTEAGFRVGEAREKDMGRTMIFVRSGRVGETDPAAGSRLRPGSTVTPVIYKGGIWFGSDTEIKIAPTRSWLNPFNR